MNVSRLTWFSSLHQTWCGAVRPLRAQAVHWSQGAILPWHSSPLGFSIHHCYWRQGLTPCRTGRGELWGQRSTSSWHCNWRSSCSWCTTIMTSLPVCESLTFYSLTFALLDFQNLWASFTPVTMTDVKSHLKTEQTLLREQHLSFVFARLCLI